MMQGRAKKEKRPMTEAVCIGVDVAKDILDVAVSNRTEIRQFNNVDCTPMTRQIRLGESGGIGH